MKKMMIMVAVAMMAVVASAASTDWKFVAGNVFGSDGATKFTGSAALYCASVGGASDVLVTTAAINNGVGGYAFSSDLFTADEVYDFYFVMEDAGKTFTSATKTGVKALATGTANIGFGNMQTATQTASNWVGGTEGAPEPTSGLLLLLGAAGLALKRKVA